MPHHHIIRIESYEGTDTFIHCGTDAQDHLYAVIATDDASSSAEIVDSGYRTREEAAAAWPSATLPPCPP